MVGFLDGSKHDPLAADHFASRTSRYTERISAAVVSHENCSAWATPAFAKTETVTGELHRLVGDQRGRLGLAQPQPATPAAPGQLGGEEEVQALLLGGQQPHPVAACTRAASPSTYRSIRSENR